MLNISIKNKTFCENIAVELPSYSLARSGFGKKNKKKTLYIVQFTLFIKFWSTLYYRNVRSGARVSVTQAAFNFYKGVLCYTFSAWRNDPPGRNAAWEMRNLETNEMNPLSYEKTKSRFAFASQDESELSWNQKLVKTTYFLWFTISVFLIPPEALLIFNCPLLVVSGDLWGYNNPLEPWHCSGSLADLTGK